MSILFANNALSTLAGSINDSATACTLAAGTGSKFPNPTGSNYFMLTFTDASTGLLNEIVKVTARSGDVLTIVRAQEGTSAQSWAAGDNANALITAGALAAFSQQANARTPLTTDTTFYVSTTGSDVTGDGLTALTAWQTIQHAFDVFASSYDFAGHAVTVSLANGVYATAATMTGIVPGQTSSIRLYAPGSSAGVQMTATLTCNGGNVAVENFAMNGTTAIQASNGGAIYVLAGMLFTACSTKVMGATTKGIIYIQNTYTYQQNSPAMWVIGSQGQVVVAASAVVTGAGVSAFSTAFADVHDGGLLLFNAGASFSGGTQTGQRYAVQGNGVIQTNGSGASFIPGNIAGVASTGGQYV